jgi:uncharacterized membrane protein YfcA
MTYIVGFLIALGVGLTGVGAGSITAPVLILFFGLSPAVSVGTALAFAAVIKLAVAPLYLFRRQVHRRILLLLCLGGIPGVLAGVLVLGGLNVKRHEQTVFVILGLTIGSMALYSLFHSLRRKPQIVGRDRTRWLPWIAAGIGGEVGFSSAGAGALGSLVLLNLTTLTPAQVVGTDMLFGLVVSVVGGGFHVFAGHYDAAILRGLLIGGLGGAFAGAWLSSILPAKPLRIALSLCLVGLGGQLFWRGLF